MRVCVCAFLFLPLLPLRSQSRLHHFVLMPFAALENVQESKENMFVIGVLAELRRSAASFCSRERLLFMLCNNVFCRFLGGGGAREEHRQLR